MMAAGVLACLAACNKEQYTGNDPVQSGDMHAYIVAPTETRTDFDSYVGKFAWSEGDKIAIHLSDGTFYSTRVNAETGAFACSTTPTKKRDAYAIYPATAADASNYGSPTLNVVLPAEYDISDNLSSDYSPVPMIAVNKQAEDDLYFRHVGGLLRITCDRVPVGTQKIAVTLDRNIAGTFTVTNPASENPTISSGGNTQTVTFSISETALTQRANGIVLNLPVPVGPVATLKVAALNASGAEIYADTRDIDLNVARYHGKKFVYSLTEVFYDSMQMVISVNSDSELQFSFGNSTLHAFPAYVTVDWGDGSYDMYQRGVMQHTYSSAGDYLVTVSAESLTRNGDMLPAGISFSRLYGGRRGIIKAVLTPFLKMAGNTDRFQSMFRGCSELSYIPGDLFSKNPDITDLASAFAGCKSLKEIPEDLFSYTPHVTVFSWVFSDCSGLTGPIPARLFSENREAVYFDYAFGGCSSLAGSIPGELFASNSAAQGFQGVFNKCSSLTGSIPGELFANNPAADGFYGTFYGCSGLTGPIPANLFANNPSAASFTSTFRECSNLSGPIPGTLFANNPAATEFFHSFEDCFSLSGEIPANLFAGNPAVTRFSYTFYRCWGLTGAIPESLFANNPAVTEFNYTFNNCSGLTGGIPAGLFANNTAVISFGRTFCGCSGLTGSIPAGLFANNTAVTSFGGTFFDCSNLTGNIPSGLFANNTAVTSFNDTFNNCHRLSGSIPAGLFDNNTAVTSFSYTFGACDGLRGSIPTGLFDNNTAVTNFSGTFFGCSGLSGSIPAGLFDNNPAVTSFSATFRGCWGLTGTIPDGLFDKNTAVTTFRETFLTCYGMTGDMPHGLFSKNLKAYDFNSTFAYCYGLNVVPDLFTDTVNTPATRFASDWYVQQGLGFSSCFFRIGGGTAPDIWDHTLWTANIPNWYYSGYAHCFKESTNITNYDDIPDDWKN